MRVLSRLLIHFMGFFDSSLTMCFLFTCRQFTFQLENESVQIFGLTVATKALLYYNMNFIFWPYILYTTSVVEPFFMYCSSRDCAALGAFKNFDMY